MEAGDERRLAAVAREDEEVGQERAIGLGRAFGEHHAIGHDALSGLEHDDCMPSLVRHRARLRPVEHAQRTRGTGRFPFGDRPTKRSEERRIGHGGPERRKIERSSVETAEAKGSGLRDIDLLDRCARQIGEREPEFAKQLP